MRDRQPTIDAQTWEELLGVYGIIAAADNGNKQIEATDLAWAHAKMEGILKFNSLPAVDPRSNPTLLERLKKLGRQMLP